MHLCIHFPLASEQCSSVTNKKSNCFYIMNLVFHGKPASRPDGLGARGQIHWGETMKLQTIASACSWRGDYVPGRFRSRHIHGKKDII